MLDKIKSAWRAVFGPRELRIAAASHDLPNWQTSWHTGDKFTGGFGVTHLLTADYWTLRARSAQLFETNLYARGLIRRLINNEINTGLHLECTPMEKILGVPEDSLVDWAEDVEDRFHLWSKDPWLCDHSERRTFGALQAAARMEALVAGDVLVVLRQHQVTGLPRVQLINGASVQNPNARVKVRDGHRIVHGVELDAADRHVAFWVRQSDGTSKRLPAWGEKSGRRLAWLVYGTDKRLDDVRGTPILGLVLQSLKEIDRYRDSMQRKAVILSMLAMFVKKSEARPGTMPISSGAVRRGIDTTVDSTGTKRSYNVAEHVPGLTLDELQPGEEPQAFSVNGTTENFGTFEEAILQSIAWANEVPPEILRLSFSSNYSASQAAINEFKMYLNRVRTAFGEDFCQPIYVEWLISQALTQKVSAPGLLETWRDDTQYDLFNAWVLSDWSGHVKPAVDASKLVRGYKEMVNEGFITRDRAARELTGQKYTHNVKKLRKENAILAEALEPLKQLESPDAQAPDPVTDNQEPDDGEDSGDDSEDSPSPGRRGKAA